MAVSRAVFIVRYLEFAKADAALVTAKIDQAVRRYDEGECGDQYDDVVYLRAAHLLAMTPWGRAARLVNKDGTTVYAELLAETERNIGAGAQVL